MNTTLNRPQETAERLNQKLTDAMMAALKTVRSTTSPDSMDAKDLAYQRKGQEVLGRLMSPPIGFSWEPFVLDGMPMAWVRPERGHSHNNVILYCHGGGYTSGNPGYARVLAAKMASATGCEVLAFQYRLAPEFPYPAALEDALKAWESLMHQGWGAKNVILAGHSAGGNLALELTLALKAEGRLLPGRLVLFSPWTDMTASGESYTQREELDPMLTNHYIQSVRRAYAPETDYSLPQFSPLFADLSGLPPTLIQVGEREILYSDSKGLQQALISAEVPCVLQSWPDMWHVFQMFPLKSAGEAMTAMAEFLRQLGC
ncbi:monooxygenase [Flavonifractor sp. An92]|uniref:alpha/beta hydrolase n=1 Tax=Flavonifractor sp. An92 TaxID=1965666 RepID=UPI000B38B448|nr:alpha/beta hydrolase [Flavonifractor sp. An92]OUN05665.1 monooxygenase [Flavonifractor sp. An92]